MIEISEQAKYDIIEDARKRAPQESCGLLVAGKYVPLPNVAEDPVANFEIDPTAVLEAQLGGKLQAIIHSHIGPDAPNSPSRLDMEMQAAGDVPWGIVYLDPVYKPDLFFWGDQLPIAPYEGRVFRHGVADCFALVRDWYRKEKGVTLKLTPRDPEWWGSGQNVIEECLNTPGYFDFVEVPHDAPLEVGDVVIGKVGAKVINHTGVYVGNGLVLHHLTNRLSRKDVFGPFQRFIVKRMRMRPVQSIAQEGV